MFNSKSFFNFDLLNEVNKMNSLIENINEIDYEDIESLENGLKNILKLKEGLDKLAEDENTGLVLNLAQEMMGVDYKKLVEEGEKQIRESMDILKKNKSCNSCSCVSKSVVDKSEEPEDFCDCADLTDDPITGDEVFAMLCECVKDEAKSTIRQQITLCDNIANYLNTNHPYYCKECDYDEIYELVNDLFEYSDFTLNK